MHVLTTDNYSQECRTGWCQVRHDIRSRTSYGARSRNTGALALIFQVRILIFPSTKFFLRETDIGKSRAAACLSRLAELNAYVPVRNLGGVPGQEITPELVQGFQVCGWIHFSYFILYSLQVVVLCGVSWKKQLEINDWTHTNDVHFIAAETRGLFGFVMSDR